MRFEKVFDAWSVTLSKDRRELKTYTFQDSRKVEEMAERGGAFKDLACRQGVEFGLRQGLGACELRLMEEQWEASRPGKTQTRSTFLP
jgi:hypothetical protein